MKPIITGQKYDKIAIWWDQQHHNSNYGVKAFEKALRFHPSIVSALDIGCGAGGRFIKRLEKKGVKVTGLDVSKKMIELAIKNHPNQRFECIDIANFKTDQKFDFIYAWDSIFHLPLSEHQRVVKKLCNFLNPHGIILYTFGNEQGEHTDTWKEDKFYYSSIGINENLKVLIDSNITIMHLELDQYPEKHVFVIGKKEAS